MCRVKHRKEQDIKISKELRKSKIHYFQMRLVILTSSPIRHMIENERQAQQKWRINIHYEKGIY